MINSNNTQRNSDHDFTKLWKRILGNQGGVESKEQFIFDNDTKKLSAGSDIATAYILCTRPASNPIPNQKFLAQFEFTGSLDFLNITNGDKIFIEIKENLVKDPTLIEDLDSQTNYNQGLGIWEIKIAKNYPNHSNYLKLYEWNDGQLVDLRKAISLPAIDEVAQRTDSLEEKMTTAEGKIEKLEEAGGNENFSKKWLIGASYEDWDTLYMNRILQIYETSQQRSIVDSSYEKVYFIWMANWVGFDKISFPIYRLNNPMDWISLEIRNVVPHEWNSDIKHKPWQIVYATGQILPADIDTTAKMIEIILNAEVKLEKGALLAFVLKKNSPIYNNDQYIVRYGIMKKKWELGINCYMWINSNGLPVILWWWVSCVCSWIEQECYTKSKINLNKANLKSPFRLNSGASNYVAQQELWTIGVGKYRAIVYIQYTNHSPQGNTFELKLNGVKIKQLPNPTNTNNQTFDLWEIEILTNGMLSISCKMNTSSSGYYLQWEVRLENLVSEECDIEYIPEQVSPIGTKQKLLYYGMVNNKWKELYTKDYQKWFIAEISATGSGETKNMIIPSPWIVILSAWTDYKRVSCDIDGITIIELYHSNSWTVKETITVPVKWGEMIEVKKRDYSGGASAKFISL